MPRRGNQVFNVPNDAEGKQFLRLMSKYLNRPVFGHRSRGRKKGHVGNNAHVSRKDNPDRYSVYLDRHMEQEGITHTCTNCGGQYEQVEYQSKKGTPSKRPVWRVTKYCVKCYKGNETSYIWQPIHPRRV
jgi:hypothetical protein